MRYHFHLISKRSRILDTVGVEADSEGEAYLGATRALAELCREVDPIDWPHWSFEVADPCGRVIFTLELASRSH